MPPPLSPAIALGGRSPVVVASIATTMPGIYEFRLQMGLGGGTLRMKKGGHAAPPFVL